MSIGWVDGTFFVGFPYKKKATGCLGHIGDEILPIYHVYIYIL